MNKIHALTTLILLSALSAGCQPRFSHLSTPPTPITWQYTLDPSIIMLASTFDQAGNTYLLIGDSNIRAGSYELVKIATNGTLMSNTIIHTESSPAVSLQSDKLLIDSMNDLYIVSHDETNNQLMNAKILNDGTLAWKELIPTPVITTPDAGLSSDGRLYLAYAAGNAVHFLAYGASGTASEIYTQNFLEATHVDVQLKIGSDDNSYLRFTPFTPTADRTPPVKNNQQIIQLSAAGTLLQDFTFTGDIKDFLVSPDGTIYVFDNLRNVTKYAGNGTPLWQENIPTQRTNFDCPENHYNKAILSANGNLNILYHYYGICDADDGYDIVQLDATGQEILRLDRKLNLPNTVQPIPFTHYNQYKGEDFQLDQNDNWLVHERYLTIIVGLNIDRPFNYSYPFLTRKYDTSGNLLKEIHTSAKEGIRDGGVFTPSGKSFHVSIDGSLTIAKKSDVFQHSGAFN